MAIYVLLSRLSQQGVATLKSNPDRLREVNRDVEELGAKVLHQWATLGEFDFVNVVEAPDTATIARVSVALGARGSTRIETLPALTIDEFVQTSSKTGRRASQFRRVVAQQLVSQRCGDAADGDAPGLARLEQLVGVDVGGPADEVRLRIVGRAPVHGRVDLRRRLLAHAARELLRTTLRLLRGRSFHVAARHPAKGTVAAVPGAARSPFVDCGSDTAPSKR